MLQEFMGTPTTDLLSLKFGMLTVVARSKANHGKRYACWLCRCDCGNDVVVRGDRLRQGRKKFCSVKNHPVVGSGGPTVEHILTYRSWNSAWKRVRATDGKNWRNYGFRGITVSPRWEKFETFLADMGERPDILHTLDRIDNDGNYDPGNCRWANKSEQRRNSRGAVWIEYLGERHRLADFCEAKGLAYPVVKGRLTHGWDIERAISEPTRPKRPNVAVAKPDV